MADPTIQEEIAAIRAAISAGVKRVVTQTNGVRKEVEYPSFDDLRKRLAWLENQMPAGSLRRRRHITLASF